jgi:guanine deaminase
MPTWTRVKLRESAVAHCPLSNAYFSNAVFPLRAALEKGVNVGLGTDVSGGPSASMFENCRAAVMASRMLESGVDPKLSSEDRASYGQARIDFRDAFHIATAGGGKALDLPIGQFIAGILSSMRWWSTRRPTDHPFASGTISIAAMASCRRSSMPQGAPTSPIGGSAASTSNKQQSRK